jgi:hypothetical protein
MKKPTIVVCTECNDEGIPTCQPFMVYVCQSLKEADHRIREHAGDGYVVRRARGRHWWTECLDGVPQYVWYTIACVKVV